MKPLFKIYFALMAFQVNAQIECSFSMTSIYQVEELTDIMSDQLKTPGDIQNFSVMVSGKIKSKRFIKLFKSDSTDVSVMETTKAIPLDEGFKMVEHQFINVHYINEDITMVYLLSHSEGKAILNQDPETSGSGSLSDFLESITIFSYIGLKE